MNKKFLSLMTAILVVMMALYACKKDSGSSGGDDGNDPDNPFVGTWISDDLDGIILEVKASTWKIEFNGDLVYSGTYKPNGNRATLEITKINPEWADEDVEVGDKGTAEVSGKKLTVNFGDEDQTFTKEGGTPPGGDVYREPYVDFGASIAAVKKYETRELEDEGTYEDYDYLFYSGENKDVQSVFYLFNYDGLSISSVCLNNTSNIEQRVLNFLRGKYDDWGEEDGNYYFATSDETMVIILYYWADDDTWNVDYQDASLYTKSSLPTIQKSIKADLLRSHK